MITVDDPKKKSYGIWYDKFMNLSERVGNLLYGEVNIQTIIKTYIKSKIPKIKKAKEKKIPDMMLEYIETEKGIRKKMGAIILSSIILVIVFFILYMLNGIFNILFNSVAWWVVAIIMVAILGPIMLAIAYAIGKGDY